MSSMTSEITEIIELIGGSDRWVIDKPRAVRKVDYSHLIATGRCSDILAIRVSVSKICTATELLR